MYDVQIRSIKAIYSISSVELLIPRRNSVRETLGIPRRVPYVLRDGVVMAAGKVDLTMRLRRSF